MKNQIKTVYLVMGTLLIVMIASAISFRMLDKYYPDQDKKPDSLAKSVESFPDHSRIPNDNLKTK